MASWIIDEFKARPGGLATSWRYRRIRITDDGLVTAEGVPGKPTLNLCISSYRKDNRRTFPVDNTGGRLITSFCNIITHTQYRVYAQDCDPYAFVQSDLSVPECGYLEPLPTPGRPTLPFPAPPYGLWKYMYDCDVDGTPITVNFKRKNYSSVAQEIEIGTGSPIVISYKNSEDTRFGIIPCECILGFVVTANFSLKEFYTNDEREFMAEVYVGDELQFRGFVTPDSCREQFQSPPYEVTIRANDGLGSLKNMTYPLPVGSKSNLRQRFIDILSYALTLTNLNLDIYTVCNLYEQKMLTGLSDDPLSQAKVNPLRMSDGKGNIFNCYDVIESLCKEFFATFKQVKGAWHFIRNAELPNEVIRRRLYNKDAFLLRGENFVPFRQAGQNEDVQLINGNPVIGIGNAYKRVEVLLKFGTVPTIIFNGDFELWDGANFTFWTPYGGLDFTRVQRTIKGSAGAPIDIDNYALQFNKKADPGKWIEAEKMPTQKGDKLTINFRVSKVPNYVTLKIRFKVGSYYLFNENQGPNYEWVQSLATGAYFITNTKNEANYTFTLPEIPVSDYLYVQIFGFTDLRFGFENTDVVAWIDNISIDKSSQTDKLGVDGLLSVSDQLALYTQKPDMLEILYGDFDLSNQQVTRPTRTREPTLENDSYAIFTADESYSKGWYEYGMSNAPVTIGLALARSILKAYQKPFDFFYGDFKGDELSMNDVYSFDVEGEAEFSSKKFAILSGDFDLKFKELKNAVLVEIFNKNIVTNDASIPHTISKYGQAQISSEIDQNPDNVVQTGSGIFSEEFTQEFS